MKPQRTRHFYHYDALRLKSKYVRWGWSDSGLSRKIADCGRPHASLLVPAKHFRHQINLAPATKTQRRAQTRPRETCLRGSVGVALGDNPSSCNWREINTLVLITKTAGAHHSLFKQRRANPANAAARRGRMRASYRGLVTSRACSSDQCKEQNCWLV